MSYQDAGPDKTSTQYEHNKTVKDCLMWLKLVEIELGPCHITTCFLMIKPDLYGAPDTNRTCDPPLRRGMLYPLSYGGW
jgi:hypothetical protein